MWIGVLVIIFLFLLLGWVIWCWYGREIRQLEREQERILQEGGLPD